MNYLNINYQFDKDDGGDKAIVIRKSSKRKIVYFPNFRRKKKIKRQISILWIPAGKKNFGRNE